MARKSSPSRSDPQRDVGTDYVLIAIGVSAAVVALIYLLLI
jgi:hypothetical protein